MQVETPGSSLATDRSCISGESPQIRQVRALVATACQFDVPVLISGESGTGKELVAREIHARSARAQGPFVAMNCGAIPDGLVESEMFGHTKGAFTGAVNAREGAFKTAHSGTILLDEIGEFRLDLQVKLLRVLQERRAVPLGASEEHAFDVRVIASSNRTLGEEVEAGRFRRDLYYRLSVFPIHLPALRERGDDIMLLATNFMREFADAHERKVQGFSPEAERAMVEWSWPGNVRELRNVVERAVILTAGDLVGVETLSGEIRGGPRAMPVVTGNSEPEVLESAELSAHGQGILPIKEEERRVITRALSHGHWNIPQVAKRLGMSRATLYRRIRKHGIARPS